MILERIAARFALKSESAFYIKKLDGDSDLSSTRKAGQAEVIAL
jgi:hypothetical protein